MKLVSCARNKEVVDTLRLTTEGIEGDRPRKPGRHLTLLPAEVRQKITDGFWSRGLCVRKFGGNMTISELTDLEVGDILNIGDARVEITEAGKHCFDDCALYQEGSRCDLPVRAYFARIIASGDVSAGMDITVEKKA